MKLKGPGEVFGQTKINNQVG